MSRTVYQAFALLTLGPALFGGWLAGRAAYDGTGDAALIVGALGVLAGVIVWALVLLPFRSRAGFAPIREDLKNMKDKGIVQSLNEERAELERQQRSNDPSERRRYYGQMAMAGAAVSVAAMAGTAILWSRDYVSLYVAGAAVIGPLITVYYVVRRALVRG